METEYRENGKKEGIVSIPVNETHFAVDGRVVFKYNPKTGILERNEELFPERVLSEMFSSLVMTREKDYLLEMEPFGKILLEDIRSYQDLNREEMYIKDSSLNSIKDNVFHYMSEEYRNRSLADRIRDSMRVA